MKRKSSAGVEAAKASTHGAGDFVHAAADRVGPLVHNAADRVGPLAQAAADRVAPYAHSAADRIAPLAHTAADRVAPLAQSAAERVSPLAHQAAELVTPYAHQARELVTPYAHQAVELVGPYAQQAKERVGPYASTARQLSAQAAHDAVEALGPKLDDAFERVTPAVEAARERVANDLLPRLSGALSAAAAAPVVVEATKRGKATMAAAKGELALPEPKKKRSWGKRLAIVAAVAAVAAVVIRKLLGDKDNAWKAQPTTPYAPSKPAASTPAASAATPDAPVVAPPSESVADLPETLETDDPQEGESAHLAFAEANESADFDGEPVVETEPLSDATVADLPTDAVEPSAQTSDFVVEPEPGLPDEEFHPVADAPEALSDELEPTTEGVAPVVEDEAGTDQPKYSGEGAYVGSEPPEGFFIKGNERSMKYHTPESGGYSATSPEVWFNSEAAAEAAGFTRAQG